MYIEIPNVDLYQESDNKFPPLPTEPPQQQHYNKLPISNYASTTTLNDSIVITSLKTLQNKHILKIIRTSTQAQSQRIYSTDIDITNTKEFDLSKVLKTFCFLIDSHILQITIWNNMGMILEIKLEFESLQLQTKQVKYPMEHYSIDKISTVSHVSYKVCVIGYQNHIACLNLSTNSISYWTMIQTSRFSFGFSAVQEELTQVMALQVVQSFSLSEYTRVVSLHDSKIIIWTLNGIKYSSKKVVSLDLPSISKRLEHWLTIQACSFLDNYRVLIGMNETLLIDVQFDNEDDLTQMKQLVMSDQMSCIIDLCFVNEKEAFVLGLDHHQATLLASYSNHQEPILYRLADKQQLIKSLKMNDFFDNFKQVDEYFTRVIYIPNAIDNTFLMVPMASSINQALQEMNLSKFQSQYQNCSLSAQVVGCIRDSFQHISTQPKNIIYQQLSPDKNSELLDYFKYWKQFVMLVYSIDNRKTTPIELLYSSSKLYLLREGIFSAIVVDKRRQDNLVIELYNKQSRLVHESITEFEHIIHDRIHSLQSLDVSFILELFNELFHDITIQVSDETTRWAKCRATASLIITYESYFDRSATNTPTLPWWIPNHTNLLPTTSLIQQTFETLLKETFMKLLILKQDKNVMRHYLRLKVIQWCFFSQLDSSSKLSILQVFISSQSINEPQKIHDSFLRYIVSISTDLYHLNQFKTKYPHVVKRFLMYILPSYKSIKNSIQRADMMLECQVMTFHNEEEAFIEQLQQRQSYVTGQFQASTDLYKFLNEQDDVIMNDDTLNELAYKVEALLFGSKDHLNILDSITFMVKLPSIQKVLLFWYQNETELYASLPSFLLLHNSKSIQPQALFKDFLFRLYIIARAYRQVTLTKLYSNNDKLVLGQGFISFELMTQVSSPYMIQTMPEFETLCNLVMMTSLKTLDFQIGLQCCTMHPLFYRQHEGMAQLCIGMIQCGHLYELLQLTRSIFRRKPDYFTVVVNSILSYAFHDENSNLIYFHALYCIFIYFGYWRRASIIMNRILEIEIRDSKDDDAICLSAMTCYHFLNLELEDSRMYILSNNTDRTSNITSIDSSIMDTNKTKEMTLFLNSDLFLRLIVSYARVLLARKGVSLRKEFISCFHHDISRDFDDSKRLTNFDAQYIARGLSKAGYYVLATVFAKKVSEKMESSSIYDALIDEIICENLVPQAVILSRPTPEIAEDDQKQLEEEVYAEAENSPDLLSTLLSQSFDGDMAGFLPKFSIINNQYKNSSSCTLAKMQGNACMYILQSYLTSPMSATLSSSVLTSIANQLIYLDRGRSALPEWFIQLYFPKIEKFNKLFAPEASGEHVYANPTDLLRLYMKHGMYIQACKLICNVLLREKDERKINSNTYCLPEKGHIQFVPYNDIDMLWKLTSYALKRMKREGLDTLSMEDLIAARTELEEALKFHFMCLNLSEAGKTSAKHVFK